MGRTSRGVPLTQARLCRALDLLRRAHELAPDSARYAYVYAVALNSTGASGQAMAVLGQAHRQHPTDRDFGRDRARYRGF
jgi:predicted Zn-dependent protease